MHKLLLNREIYEEVVQVCLPQARQFIWIVTADIKDMYVEAWGLSLIHISEPTRPKR